MHHQLAPFKIAIKRLTSPTMLVGWLLLLAGLLGPLAAQAQRVALVIGNANYQAGPLRNPPNDAREIEAALQAIGFKVQKVLNANQNQMKRALRDFGAAAQGADVALLYYSGHGTQVNGENYLLPVGAVIEKEADYEVEAVSANAAMRQIAGAHPKAAIVVLDACRDNPHAAATRSTAKGLGRMDAPTGTAIAFATAPNTTASDDGQYARVLAAQLRKPGQELFDVFRNTSAEMRRLNRQEPRVSEWSITDRIYLAGAPHADNNLARPPERVTPTNPPTQPMVSAARQGMSAAGQVIKDCAECPELVVLPKGSFRMGSPASELGQYHDEGPVHAVRIDYELAVGKYAVTFEEWDACSDAGACTERPSDEGWGRGRRPVINVSWDDAQQYVKWLSNKTGKGYRLLSEAEWEYAARAGSKTAYPWGDEIGRNNANCGGCGSQWDDKQTAPVGQFAPNAFGLYEMNGNVWQWVQDVRHDDYNGAPGDGSAWTTGGEGGRRVQRGGSWYDSPRNLRTAVRFGYGPSSRVKFIGFRIARTL